MTSTNAKQRIAIVGTGKLARALALSFPKDVVAVAGRDATRVADVASLALSARGCELVGLADAPFDVLWIAVSDGAIGDVANSLSLIDLDWERVMVLHSSGAMGVQPLAALTRRGAHGIALHPNQSLRGDTPIASGTTWGITPNSNVDLHLCAALLAPLSPRLLSVSDELRPLYHAAASTASNFTVAIYAISEQLYRHAGIDAASARELIGSFMTTSVQRAQAVGARAALTGPVSRGDGGVVASQRQAIAAVLPELLSVFDALVAATRHLVDDNVPAERS